MNTEIENGLIEFLRRTLKPRQIPRESKFIGFFNSPFFLTFVAGVLLTILSLTVTAKISYLAERRQLNRDTLDSKIKTMQIFAEGIVQFLQGSYGMRKREIWLKINYMKQYEKTLRYPDGRNFKETRNFYENQRILYNKLTHPDSLCAYARAIFADADESLINNIDNIDKVLDDYTSS
jgi:hypothetical protein